MLQQTGSSIKPPWKWKLLSHGQLFATPWSIHSMEFSRQNTGVGSLSLFQGIFPTQGLNPGLLHCRQILYPLSHKGSPRILEWIAYLLSSGSSRPRNWTGYPALQVDSLPTELSGKPSNPLIGPHGQSCGEPAPPSSGLAQVQSTRRVHKQLCGDLVLPSSRRAPDQALPGHADGYTRTQLHLAMVLY